ncbi:hypothetical protein BOTU111921_11290 [Bordetella tumbae]|uniref:hypothetical protein n=1 Tax=Bordetella tumbae TaxID=1649139 RepID=UPI0039F03C62
MTQENPRHVIGPWSLGFDPVPFSELVGSEGGWVEINSPEHSGFALVVWRMEDDERSPELEATAHLITAAPELLEQLEKHSAWLSKLTDWAGVGDPDLDGLRAAIAKAKGEQA